MRLLKEPLFHFFLIGMAIFVLFHIVAPENEAAEDLETIVINENDVARMVAGFEARRNRQPSEAELKALVDATVREEVLVREARKLGLDRNDTVIRSRLSQKMDFLTEAIAASVTPEDKDLEAFLQQNPERYITPAKVAFNQVFLGETPDEGAIEQSLAALRAGRPPPDFEGSSLLPASMPVTAKRVIDTVFGAGFSDGIENLNVGEWAGPIQSGYGKHLIQVLAVEPGRLPPLNDIRSAVLQDWQRAMGEDLAQAQYETLADNYTIETPYLSGQTK